MYKHLFFDLDTTLTPSRAPMLEAHRPLFLRMCERYDVIVVTGGGEGQIHKQLPIDAHDRYYMLSQQGNHAVHKDGRLLWHEKVSPEQEAVGRAFAMKLVAEENPEALTRDDIFENRGSILAGSVIGFNAPHEIKYAYDPDQSKRRAILERHPADIAALAAAGLEVMPGGTTTFDYILSGRHKGFNIARLLSQEGWEKDDCIYLGDALFPGGNDETVIGVIETKPVNSPDDTFNFINKMLE